MLANKLKTRAQSLRQLFVRKPQIQIDPSELEFFSAGFHGDKYLLDLVDAIVPTVQLFIETGAHIGITTAYVARTFPKIRCLSCEPNGQLFRYAMKNTAGLQNAKIYRETSQQFLKRMDRAKEFLEMTPLFWLDAHGYGFEWPLREEVSFITTKFKSAYILIDDFQVPGLDCFGYDVWNGQSCSFEYIKDLLNPQLRYDLCYPAYTERTSSYHPLRGWGLITFGAASVKRITLPQNVSTNVKCIEIENVVASADLGM